MCFSYVTTKWNKKYYDHRVFYNVDSRRRNFSSQAFRMSEQRYSFKLFRTYSEILIQSVQQPGQGTQGLNEQGNTVKYPPAAPGKQSNPTVFTVQVHNIRLKNSDLKYVTSSQKYAPATTRGTVPFIRPRVFVPRKNPTARKGEHLSNSWFREGAPSRVESHVFFYTPWLKWVIGGGQWSWKAAKNRKFLSVHATVLSGFPTRPELFVHQATEIELHAKVRLLTNT